MPKTRLILGLMSGTSVDAIDAAIVRITGTVPRIRAQVLHHAALRWPKALRARLLAAMAPAATTTEELCQLHALTAHHFAQAALAAIADAGLHPSDITALASHGQTLCHLPPKSPAASFKLPVGKRPSSGNLKLETGNSTPSTLQIADPSIIATLTGITTVANFRPADIALGGQGAPLVPFADFLLLSHPTRSRAIQNIGGIANVTYLPAGNSKLATCNAPILAFDTGPGNMLLDAAISLATNGRQTYDKNGRFAARGTIDMPLFRRLQAHPYFDQRPPKSTGRETFGQQLARTLLETRNWKLETLLATLTELTAWSIADAYLHYLPELPDEIILCGGGADNPTLTARLRHHLATLSPTIRLARIDDLDGGDIPNKAKEAASFALLAAATLDQYPANLPSVTGATHPTILGVIAPAPPR